MPLKDSRSHTTGCTSSNTTEEFVRT